MGWLMMSITEDVLPKVFTSNSQVRKLQLHLTLQTAKKGDKSMKDYITHMVDIANALPL